MTSSPRVPRITSGPFVPTIVPIAPTHEGALLASVPAVGSAATDGLAIANRPHTRTQHVLDRQNSTTLTALPPSRRTFLANTVDRCLTRVKSIGSVGLCI
jgi:hypothetical protein